jgi:ubiquinone/menaquinone biosynthesis C-methylase UbiE
LNPVVKLGVSPEDTVLEIGVGLGRLIIPASFYFKQAIGVDISEQVLEMARKEVDAQRRDNIRLIPCDGQSLPVERDAVRLVYSFLVMMHIPDKSIVVKYIQESYRVLQGGGILRLQVRKSSSRFRSVDHALNIGKDEYDLSKGCTFTPRELRKVVRACGFRVIKVHGDTRRPFNTIPSKTQLWVTAIKPE